MTVETRNALIEAVNKLREEANAISSKSDLREDEEDANGFDILANVIEEFINMG